MSDFTLPALSIFSENHQLIDSSLLATPCSINTSLLFAPHSPSTGSETTSCSSNCTSPTISDNEDLFIPMDQQNNVKRLLRMFPPPMSAKEFIIRNSFQASDGHIKRPSNNFILFRKIAHDQKNQTPALSEYNERQFSQIIGKIWKGLTHDEKEIYKKLGKEVAELHKKMHPEYKYQPKRDKAAWKHFNPEVSNSTQKTKRKNNKIKQQKSQETLPELSKIDVSISQQQQEQQQQQIVSENLEFAVIEMSPMGQIDPVYEYQTTFPTNNTFTTNTAYMDYFNVNPVNDDYSIYGCTTSNTFPSNDTLFKY